MLDDKLKIGIVCYPTIGGSGIVATELGFLLAAAGHEVHFISYERPVRLDTGRPNLYFHPVIVNEYVLFKYPDYTLPLSVRISEVIEEFGLDTSRALRGTACHGSPAGSTDAAESP